MNERKTRYDRPRTPKPTRETDNLKLVTRLVYDYRILSTQQIERLLGKSQSTAQVLLRRMWDGHYIDRMYPEEVSFGSPPAYYILDKKGQELLRREGVEDFSGLVSKDTSDLFLKHTKAISEFRIMMNEAVEQQGWSIPIWHTDHELKTDYDRVQIASEDKPVSLIPDGYFTVQVTNKGTTHFFLELDRARMTLPTFTKKIEAYVAYYKSGLFTKRYGAKGFRVLTVVDNESDSQLRVENMVEASSSIHGIGRRFWFGHLPSMTSESLLYDPIWRIAGVAKQYSLFYDG